MFRSNRGFSAKNNNVNEDEEVPHDIFFSGGSQEEDNLNKTEGGADEAAETIRSRRKKGKKGKKKKRNQSFLGQSEKTEGNEEELKITGQESS